MSEPTPGPWIVGAHFAERLGGRTYIPILRPGNDPVPIAVVHRDVDGYGRGEGEANASLIAAAPDLLAVVRELIGAIKDKSIQRNPAYSSDDAKWLDKRAKAALAKAKQPGPK